jgi:hypothetical protein
MAIRMVLEGEPPVGSVDHVRFSIWADLEHFVEVLVAGHRMNATRCGRSGVTPTHLPSAGLNYFADALRDAIDLQRVRGGQRWPPGAAAFAWTRLSIS